MKVHILATCRMPELFPMTALVFKSLRVGFPTADIDVSSNNLSSKHYNAIRVLCGENLCGLRQHSKTIHHKWIEELVNAETEPFWICDTDIIFYESVEGWKFDAPLAGWRIPEWVDEFSGSVPACSTLIQCE
jgi:hypothetical protein